MIDTKFYTFKEVSVLLKTPIPYLRKLIKEHKLKAKFIDKQSIIDEKYLKTFINSLGVKNEE